MKLIVDIDEETYKKIKNTKPLGWDCPIERVNKAIKNCTPLDDIKAEIREEKEFAYADFERYKVECLGQDWEDAYDSLPQDDYRYGMERCLEIINKHISEKDGE